MKSALLFASLSALGLMAAAGEESPAPGANGAPTPPVDAKAAKAAADQAEKEAKAAAAAAKKAAVKKVKVRVLINSLGEDTATYAKGEIFETTAERAEALGDSVELVN